MDIDKIKGLATKVAKKEGFESFCLQVSPGKNKGDGFLGEILRVEVKDTRNGRKLDLAIKSSITDDYMIDIFNLKDIYGQEVYLYSEILPVINDFQRENKIVHPFTATAKYYDKLFEGKNRMIALENLRARSFDLFDKKALLDKDHVVMVLTQYARLHAFSFAYRKKHPEHFSKLTEPLKNFWYVMAMNNKQLMQTFENTCQELSDVVKSEGDFELANAYRKYVEGCCAIFRDVCVYEGKYSAILHGDCWSNNMMFRYREINGKKKLEDVCLLDWQVTHVGTPVYDLSYFLYSGASKEVYSNLDDLLNIYHDSFSITVREYGEDAESLYPLSALKADWQKYCKFGLILGLVVLKGKLINNDEVKELHDLANVKEGEKADFFMTDNFDKDNFEERSKNLIKHVFELGAL